MFLRLLYQSFRRQQRRKLLAGVAVAFGIALATAMIGIAMDVGDKMNRELRSYGANIIVYPEEDSLDVEIAGQRLKPASKGAFLNEKDLPRVRGIFWANNIIGFAPVLPAQAALNSGGSSAEVQILGTYFSKQINFGNSFFTTGIAKTHPWWKVGSWPADDKDQALAGEKLASQLGLRAGDRIQLSGHWLKVVGVFSSGGEEDNEIIVPLRVAQAIVGHPGVYRKLYVSALTKPEDALARRNPDQMSPAMRDQWYCSPYANSIAFQLQQAIPHARAEQIRQVAQNEGSVLTRISGLMWLISLAALTAACLAVSSAMATTVFEQRREIGLMKSLGATNGSIAMLFFSEAAILALVAALVGFLAGNVLARRIGVGIFGSSIEVHPALLPVVLLAAVAVTFVGSLTSIRSAMRLEPAQVLRGSNT